MYSPPVMRTRHRAALQHRNRAKRRQIRPRSSHAAPAALASEGPGCRRDTDTSGNTGSHSSSARSHAVGPLLPDRRTVDHDAVQRSGSTVKMEPNRSPASSRNAREDGFGYTRQPPPSQHQDRGRDDPDGLCTSRKAIYSNASEPINRDLDAYILKTYAYQAGSRTALPMACLIGSLIPRKASRNP